MKFQNISNYLLLAFTVSFLPSCGGSSDSKTPNTETLSNTPPVISNMTTDPIYERDVFSFIAETNDSDGSITSYLWEQISGTEVTELVSDSATLSFTAPNIANEEMIIFKLTVSDNSNASTSAELNIKTLAYEGLDSLTFKDNGLSTCLKSDVNNDLAMIYINCDGITINSFEDLTHFKKLESISFTNAQLEDISSISTLTQLNSVDLSYNNIKDASPVSSLTNLTNLNLSQNKIININSIFSELTALTTLSLNHVHPGSYQDYPIDVSMLGHLINLTELTVSNADIINTSSLDKLINLVSLNISYTGKSFNSLSFLKYLPKLEIFKMTNVLMSDYSPIKELTNLKELNLSSSSHVSNNNFDLTMLSDMTELTVLNLDYMPISQDTSILTKHTNLTSLSLKNTKISNIDFVEALTNLETLDLSSNFDLEEITSLSQLENMKELNLSYTRISDMSSLSNLANLLALNISSNNISEISFLTKLTNLVKLNIDGLYYNNGNNKLDLTPLSVLNKLEELVVSSNEFFDLTALESLTNLQVLDMSWCNLAGLFDFTLLSQLHTLDLSHTELVSLSGLENATNLKKLTIQESFSLTDISALQNATSLAYFNMWGVYQVDDITPLTSLVNIEYLNLGGNPNLTNINALNSMTSLLELNLRYSEKISNIDVLFTLPSLASVNLEYLPLILCSDLDKMEQIFPDANIKRHSSCMSN